MASRESRRALVTAAPPHAATIPTPVDAKVVAGVGNPAWTPVLTPGGWNTVGTVQAGDLLFGSDGLPVTVTHKRHLGVQSTARVVFADRGSILAGLDQEWPVRVGSPDGDQVTLATKALMRTLDTSSVWALIPQPVTATPIATGLGRPLSAVEAGRLGFAYGQGDEDAYTALLDALGCDPTAAAGWQIPTPVLLGSFAVRVEFLRNLPWGQMTSSVPSRAGLRDLRNLLRALGAGAPSANLGLESVDLPPPVAHLVANPTADADAVAAQYGIGTVTTTNPRGLVRVAAALPGIPRDLVGIGVDSPDNFYVADNLVLTTGCPSDTQLEGWA